MNVTDTADLHVRLAAELSRLGRRLDGIGEELLALRAGPSTPSGVTSAAGPGVAGGAAGSPGAAGGPASDARADDRTPPDGLGVVSAGQASTGGPLGPQPAGAPPVGGGQSAALHAGGPYVGGPLFVGPHPGGPDFGGPHPDGPQARGGPQAGGPYPGGPQAGGPYPGVPLPGVPYSGGPQAGGRYPGAPHAAGPYPGAPYPGGSGRAGSPFDGPPAGYRPASPAPVRGRFLPSLSALSGARLLAWTGGAVTLLGVVMLLVLAASRGWFSPPARIGAGAVLGVVLVGLGYRLHRKESARTGAVALAATGFATLYLVVAAATAIYDYLAAIPALLLALLVAGLGLGLADRWRTQLLGGGVVVGAALLAPALATDWLLVALVLALQLAALPVVLRRRWPALMVVAAAGPVLYGTVVGGIEGSAGEPGTIAAVLGVLVVGIGTALLAAGSLPTRPVAVLVGSSPVPVLLTGTAVGGWAGAALVAVAALLLGLLASRPGTDRVVRVVASTAAAVALFQATAIALDGAAATAVVLGEAIVAAGLATATRLRFPLLVGMGYGLFGVLQAAAEDAPLAALVIFPEYPYVQPGMAGALLVGAGISVLVLALAVALLVAAGRVGWVRPDARSAGLWVPIGVVGLYGATSLVVTLALLVSPDRTGFTAGHALVTVSWTIVALGLLARGISRPALRVTGLVLVAAAVAKLVLFDLVALDGMARVAAFLGAGLVLLAAGTRYARLVAEATAPRAPGGPGGSSGPATTGGPDGVGTPGEDARLDGIEPGSSGIGGSAGRGDPG